MTSTPVHHCSCHAAVRRTRASWMLAAFAFVLLQAVAPCHVGAAMRGGRADLQRLIDSAYCVSGQLRLSGDQAKGAGDGRDGSPSALSSGCLHCVGVRDGLFTAPATGSRLALIDGAPEVPRADVRTIPPLDAWAPRQARGPPAVARASA